MQVLIANEFVTVNVLQYKVYIPLPSSQVILKIFYYFYFQINFI